MQPVERAGRVVVVGRKPVRFALAAQHGQGAGGDQQDKQKQCPARIRKQIKVSGNNGDVSSHGNPILAR